MLSISMSKGIARWSEMGRSMLLGLLMVMQTRSSVCPFFKRGKVDMLGGFEVVKDHVQMRREPERLLHW